MKAVGTRSFVRLEREDSLLNVMVSHLSIQNGLSILRKGVEGNLRRWGEGGTDHIRREQGAKVGLNQGFNVKQRMCPVACRIMKAPNFVAVMTEMVER